MIADSLQSLVSLSIVIPVLNDAERLGALLKQLKGFSGEVIVVDGGSRDDSITVAQALGGRVVESAPGRAKQMNVGARCAKGNVLWFLHADTILPDHYEGLVLGAMRGAQFDWGRFDVRLSGQAVILRVVEFMMNTRSSWTGICTGDQGIFVKTEVFKQVGGYPEISLMEDVAFSKRMIRKPFRIRHALITSSRRWESQGIVKTILLMWWLRLRYFFGANPEDLAAAYSERAKDTGSYEGDSQ